jgi:hypothetical protein
MLHLTIGVDASPIMGVPDTALDGRRLVNGERTLGFVVGALTFSSVSPSPRWLDRFGYFGARTAETK